MSETMQELTRISENPYTWLADWKKRTGRKVIGCFPMYAPFELVHAAGVLPIELLGASGNMSEAAAYLQSTTCYPVRGVLELFLTGELDFLDGAVFSTICTGAGGVGEIWQSLNKLPFHHSLNVPRKPTGQANLDFFAYQIKLLRSALEALTGKPITDEAISQSIKLYNSSRKSLEKLYNISQANPDALSSRDFAAVRAASCFMPREDYNASLSRLLSELSGAAAPSTQDRIKLVTLGNLCDLPQFALMSIIDESGVAVAEDDTSLGKRLWFQVSESGDPVLALAKRYIDGPPCATKCDETVEAHAERLLGLVKSSEAKGVLFIRPLYCDPGGLEYPLLTKRLNEAQIPSLILDLNGRETTSGQWSTRLQAFVEMLRS